MAYGRRLFLRQATAAAFSATALSACATRPHGLRIGFVVKQPEVQWFQDEWRFAEVAARQYGFELVRIGATDGDRVLTAIDTLGAKGAGGFVICTPDPKLGVAIKQAALINDLKVMSVDDRLVGPDGHPIASIPHVGISALKIGGTAGEVALKEARARGWNLAEVGLLQLSFDSLQTAQERLKGSRDYLLGQGLTQAQVYDAPQRTTDTEGGFNAANPVVGRQSAVKKWFVMGMNDESVLGGVRACEGLGLAAADVIGVGIGGSATAQAEFDKAKSTGFFATILLSPKAHGYETAKAMYLWIAKGVVPAPVTYTEGFPMHRDNYKALLAEQNA
jgi:ABC-type sugar transport system substrate-binding protein